MVMDQKTVIFPSAGRIRAFFPLVFTYPKAIL